MRSDRTARFLTAALLAVSFEAGSASADLVRYSWSGRVEPAPGAGNPWSLSGDGSALTANDGTPFTVEALVDVEAVDQDGTLNPDHAWFEPTLLTLDVGGHLATLTSPRILFHDDQFQGLFDSLDLQTQAELFGTTLSFSAGVRMNASTFDLASPPAPDPTPVFADTLPIQFGGHGSTNLVTLPQNATVTGSLEICAGPTSVDWTTPTAGAAAEIDVVVAGLEEAVLARFELRGADFAAAELCSTAQAVSYATGSDWTVSLSPPVVVLLLYAKFWRGAGGDADPVTYQFDAPFTILSGLAEASVSNGDTLLSLPGSGFHDGILQFDGPLASLSVETNSNVLDSQGMTFAMVPEPGAASASLATLAALLFLRRRCAVSGFARRKRTTGLAQRSGSGGTAPSPTSAP